MTTSSQSHAVAFAPEPAAPMADAAAAPPGGRDALWPAAWYRLSLRAQLLLVFVVIDLVAILVAGSVTIVRARISTRIEISASMSLAEALVAETIRLTQQQTPANAFSETMPLRQRFMRHVRISVRNAANLPVSIGPAPAAESATASERSPAPAWFAALIAPPVDRRELPIVANRQRVGSILITGEPGDEIAEVWENTVALATAGTVLNFAVIALLYLLFGRVLGPLSVLAQGLRDLEHRNYRVRLSRPGARELSGITDRFNALAEALDTARAENSRLNHRLITAQDDERRRTALELHDEVGPCLFGLKANATSLATVAAALAEPEAARVRERAGDMLGIVDHLQAINRSLLNRLRPMALGNIPLGDLLGEVIRERARQYPHLAISFAADGLAPGYGDSIDLTIYRCVQEGLTNAIRHADAKTITVMLAEVATANGGHGALLTLTVSDDGRGIAPDATTGLGLSGMRERVGAFGGDFRLDGAPGGGTLVHITIPLDAPATAGDGANGPRPAGPNPKGAAA